MSRIEFSAKDPRYLRPSGHKHALTERFLTWLLSALLKPSNQTIGEALGKRAPSILIIRHNAIGDAVVSSVLIAAMKHQYPGATIEVLASSRNAEAFRWISDVSKVHVWPSLAGDRWAMIKQLRDRFDLVFQTLFDENFTKRTLSARVIANRGALIGPRRGRPSDGLYEHAVPLPLGSYTSKLLALLEPLGAPPPHVLAEQFPRYQLQLPQTCFDQAREFLRQHGLREHDYLVLNLSAGALARSLKPQQATEVARALIAKGHKVVLSCAPGDREDAIKVLAQVPKLIDGKFSSLGHAMAVVSLARLYVGPDTGTAHFAAAAQVPCVCVFPYTGRPDSWSPYGTGFMSLQANLGQELGDISPHQIVELVELLLADPTRQHVVMSMPLNYPKPNSTPGVVIHDERLTAKTALRIPQSS